METISWETFATSATILCLGRFSSVFLCIAMVIRKMVRVYVHDDFGVQVSMIPGSKSTRDASIRTAACVQTSTKVSGNVFKATFCAAVTHLGLVSTGVRDCKIPSASLRLISGLFFLSPSRSYSMPRVPLRWIPLKSSVKLLSFWPSWSTWWTTQSTLSIIVQTWRAVYNAKREESSYTIHAEVK